MKPLPDGHDEGIPADVDAEQYHVVQEYSPSKARLAAAATFDDQEPEEKKPW